MATIWRRIKNSLKEMIESVQEIGNINPATETFFDQYCTAKGEFDAKNEKIKTEVVDLLDIVRDLIKDTRSEVYDVEYVLKKCTCSVAVLNARHEEDGFTLLQFAIIFGRLDIVRLLLLLGSSLNYPVCCYTLHLACKLNYTEIGQALLNHGADANVMACVCYPESHSEPYKQYDHYSMQWVNGCLGDFGGRSNNSNIVMRLPIYYAILADNVGLVKLLVSRTSSTTPGLHVACKLGSYHCMRYFLQTGKRNVFKLKDNKGKTPIQYAIRHGVNFVKCLVINGADVYVCSAEDDTLLHLLFKETVFGSAYPLNETLAFLLEEGLVSCINSINISGSTPLHVFVEHAHKCRSKLIDKEKRRTALEDIVKCAEILLDKGASATIQTTSHETVLHLLIKPPNMGASKKSVKFASSAPSDMELVEKLMGILLSHGADPNINIRGYSLATLLLNNVLRPLNTHSYEQFYFRFHVDLETNIKHCLTSLCFYDYILLRPREECLLHLVLEHVDNIGIYKKFPINYKLKSRIISQYVSFLISLVGHLLKLGCNSNKCKITQSDLHVMYHRMAKYIQVVPSHLLREFVVLFLFHGTDSNLGGKHIPMSVFRRSAKVHSPIYPVLHVINLLSMKCTKLPHTELWRIFYIYYSTMSDKNIHLSIENYLEYDRHRFKTRKLDMEEYLMSIISKPRPLQQQCARRIYHILSRQLKRIDMLPLPNLIRQYLRSCEW